METSNPLKPTSFLVDPVSEFDAKFVFQRCEELGEANARKAVASNYFTTELRPMAELWLRQKEEHRQERLNKQARWMARRTELAAWLAVAFGVFSVVQTWLGK